MEGRKPQGLSSRPPELVRERGWVPGILRCPGLREGQAGKDQAEASMVEGLKVTSGREPGPQTGSEMKGGPQGPAWVSLAAAGIPSGQPLSPPTCVGRGFTALGLPS